METGSVSHPMLVAVIDAKRLNNMIGAPMIAPWELDPGHELTEWIEVADALVEIPSIRARRKAQDAYFERMRRKHPNYAPLHYRH